MSRMRNYSDEEVKKLEEEVGGVLSDSYKRFLLSFDGTLPHKRFFVIGNGDTSRIHHFFGFECDDDGQCYPKFVGERYSVETLKLLPIADDPFGNYICLDISASKDGNGAIFFVEHESLNAEYINKTHLSGDYDSFIDALMSSDENDVYIKSAAPETWDDFEAQLEEMKRLRQLEISKKK